MRIETVTTETKCKATITADMIREAFGIPSNAEIFFNVPGGGDYSNCRLDVDLYPLSAYWVKIEHDQKK